MGFLDSVSNFLNGPGLPSPYACNRPTSYNEVDPEFVKLLGSVLFTWADLAAILTSLNSHATPCNLRSVLVNPALGSSEQERTNTFARKIAEYTIRTKFARDHQPLPSDSKEVRTTLAQMSEERKIAVINALAAKIGSNLTAKLREAGAKTKGGLSPEQKTAILIELFFPTQSLKDNYNNWCPSDEDPLPRCDVLKQQPPPEPVVLPMTTEELLMTTRGERANSQAERAAQTERYDDPNTRRYREPRYPTPQPNNYYSPSYPAMRGGGGI